MKLSIVMLRQSFILLAIVVACGNVLGSDDATAQEPDIKITTLVDWTTPREICLEVCGVRIHHVSPTTYFLFTYSEHQLYFADTVLNTFIQYDLAHPDIRLFYDFIPLSPETLVFLTFDNDASVNLWEYEVSYNSWKKLGFPTDFLTCALGRYVFMPELDSIGEDDEIIVCGGSGIFDNSHGVFEDTIWFRIADPNILSITDPLVEFVMRHGEGAPLGSRPWLSVIAGEDGEIYMHVGTNPFIEEHKQLEMYDPLKSFVYHKFPNDDQWQVEEISTLDMFGGDTLPEYITSDLIAVDEDSDMYFFTYFSQRGDAVTKLNQSGEVIWRVTNSDFEDINGFREVTPDGKLVIGELIEGASGHYYRIRLISVESQ